MRTFAAKLRGFLGQPRDDGSHEEIQEHLRLLADRFEAQGMSREDAALAARRQFGNTTLLQEDRRAMQTFPSVEALWYDLRYALRVLWKERAFAGVSIVTLGLGIGAATAIFSVIYNVFHQGITAGASSPAVQQYAGARFLERVNGSFAAIGAGTI